MRIQLVNLTGQAGWRFLLQLFESTIRIVFGFDVDVVAFVRVCLCVQGNAFIELRPQMISTILHAVQQQPEAFPKPVRMRFLWRATSQIESTRF